MRRRCSTNLPAIVTRQLADALQRKQRRQMRNLMSTAIKAIILSLAFAVISYSFVSPSWATRQNREETKGTTISSEQLAHAKTLFKERCSRCHGRDGAGTTTIGAMLDVPDFTNPKWWRKEVTAARLIQSVANGKNDMPAFGRKIPKREIESLIA